MVTSGEGEQEAEKKAMEKERTLKVKRGGQGRREVRRTGRRRAEKKGGGR